MSKLLDFDKNNTYITTKMGSQIIVGLMAKTRTENVNRRPGFLGPRRTSDKIIKENTTAGKSGLGDWIKRNKNGRKTR